MNRPVRGMIVRGISFIPLTTILLTYLRLVATRVTGWITVIRHPFRLPASAPAGRRAVPKRW